ncbi:MAG: glutathione transferase GstA [Myxococcota bacterium]|nr:glutathione transferase GstA [Myxococcota bacterium]
MKLYYAPGTCALASHIVLAETKLPFTAIRVDLREKKFNDGSEYLKVNPKGYVPALELADGKVITEGPVILQYIADQAPSANLTPAAGTFERIRMHEWLTFVSSEIHKTYSPMFDKTLDAGTREKNVEKLKKRYAFVEETLAKQPFLAGPLFGIADAYLFTVTRWAESMKVDLSAFPAIRSFMERVGSRDSVKTALADEGIKN